MDVANKTSSTLRVSAWFAALTLDERLAANRPRIAPTDEGRRRLGRWRAQSPFDLHPDLWRARLAEHRLEEETFAALLSEGTDDLAARVPVPAWMVALDAALAAFADGVPTDPCAERVIGRLSGYPRAALRLALPFVLREVPKLRESLVIATASGVSLDLEAILGSLIEHVVEIVGIPLLRTTSLEVNVARRRGLLVADTREGRFDEFIDAASDRDTITSFYERHPVLARHVSVVVAHYVDACRSFLAHLVEDFSEIRRVLADGAAPGDLVEVRPGAGDTHRGGKTVMHLRFSSGFRTVYKPRSGAVDVAFAQALAMLNDGSGAPNLAVARAPRLVTHGDRTFAEFIEKGDAADRSAVARFYARQGAHLALFYVLGAADMHAENMIAAGEDPVLIDLEALFTHRARLRPELEDTNPAADHALSSVLGALFLPVRVEGTDEAPGFDVSALGNRPGQVSARAAPLMNDVGTDEMRVSYARQEIEAMASRPTLDGVELDADLWLHEICNGFTRAWRALAGRSDAFVVGPLDAFRNVAVRVIPRATMIYAKILTTSYHPDFLADGLERERIFDRLYLAARYEPSLVRLIPSERADLHEGDVPFFSTRPSSRDVVDARGHVLESAVPEAAFDAATYRAKNLTEEELARQLWLVRASFATIPMGDGQKHWPSSDMTLPPAPVDRRDLLLRAHRIGERLEALATRKDERVGWMAVSLQRERDWVVLPTQTDLYNGTTGIALFLAHLAAVTGERRFRALAMQGMETMLPRLRVRLTSETPLPVGIIGEVSGPLFALSHVGALFGGSGLLDAADEIAAALPRHIDKDKDHDVAEGAAGCILALLALHAVRRSARVLDLARHCGERVVANAIARDGTFAWRSTIPSTVPLAGFGHGASGVAIALLRLADATGEARFADVARGALAYERTLFDETEQNWPDYRSAAAPDSTDAFEANRVPAAVAFMNAWCHGAPGIGLARIEAARRLDGPHLADEARIAARTTSRRGFGQNHCACHGDFGNLELLFAAQPSDPSGPKVFEEHLARVVASLDHQGPLPGVPLGIETPGLFAGLAGIGYQLLRFADPGRVPSLLTFEPPR